MKKRLVRGSAIAAHVPAGAQTIVSAQQTADTDTDHIREDPTETATCSDKRVLLFKRTG